MANTVSVAKSREQIYQALFDLVSGATFSRPIQGRTTWNGRARKYVDPSQAGLDQTPFLAQSESYPEQYIRKGARLPPIRELGARLWLWANVQSGDTGELGATYINTMIEAIEAALAPETFGFGEPNLLTLGGLVQWCRIEGIILRFPADVDHWACACVPVKILWP